MRNSLQNAGFSLIEIMLSLGIISASIFGAVELNKMIQSSQQYAQRSVEAQAFHDLLSGALLEKKNFGKENRCINLNLETDDGKFTNKTKVRVKSGLGPIGQQGAFSLNVVSDYYENWSELENKYVRTSKEQKIPDGSKTISKVYGINEVKEAYLDNVHSFTEERHSGEVVFVVEHKIKAGAPSQTRTYKFPVYFDTKKQLGNEVFSCMVASGEDDDRTCEMLGGERRDNRKAKQLPAGHETRFHYEYDWSYCEGVNYFGPSQSSVSEEVHNQCNECAWNYFYFYDQGIACKGLTIISSEPFSYPIFKYDKYAEDDETCQLKREDSCRYLGGSIGSDGNCDMCRDMGGTWYNGFCSVLNGAPTDSSGSPPETPEYIWVVNGEFVDLFNIDAPDCRGIIGSACDTPNQEKVCKRTWSTKSNWDWTKHAWVAKLNCQRPL